MLRLLRPCETAATIFDVDYARLYAEGKRVVLFDLDDTLASGRPDDVSPEVMKLLGDLEARGFRVGIISNRRRVREDSPLWALKERFPVRFRARKPRRSSFCTLLERVEATAAEAVMIGDRRLTDIVGANRLGIHSIRVLRRRRERVSPSP